MNDSNVPFHHQRVKKGVLLVQLGTPDSPTSKSVRRFLKEFLSDKRVIGLPRVIWYPILYGFVLTRRPRRLAKDYQRIWTKGSPLWVISQEIHTALQKEYQGKAVVKLACRYGQSDIASAMHAFSQEGVDDICVLPLYPQYSATTTASVFDALSLALGKMSYLPSIRWVNGYADHPTYIQLLCASIKKHWQIHGQSERLLLSFHGLPKTSRQQGDPYACFCEKTARLIRENLNLTQEFAPIVYQSRFGYAKWLEPYCTQTLEGLGNQGIKTVDVICPGFSTDCLETLEEMHIQNKALFLASGGDNLRVIPCLNRDGVPLYARLIDQFLS